MISMGKENVREISGRDLAKLMGVDPKQYQQFSVHRFGHSALDPKDIFGDGKIVTNFPEGVKRVARGKYKSGEVWMDTGYEVIYLYIGRTLKGKDVVMELGGDTPYAGTLEQGLINSGGKCRIFFDQKLFPA
jgi:hypothetical protein